MLEKYLNNRFLILYLMPFIIGSLTVFTFQPYNLTFLNFLVLPIFFYLAVYINKKSKSTFRKKPYKKNLFIFGSLFGFGFYLAGISWITNSLTFDENFKLEFDKLWIHGLVHLFGYDHKKEKDYRKMSQVEKNYLKYIQ